MQLRRSWIWLWLFALAGLLWAQGLGRSHAISIATQLQPGEVLVCTQGGMVRMRLDGEPAPTQPSSASHQSDHCSVCSLAGAAPIPPSCLVGCEPTPQVTAYPGLVPSREPLRARPLLAHAPPQGPPQRS
ncbi:hypothetical protein MCEMSEM47_01277 [Burkholderiales bacterium]